MTITRLFYRFALFAALGAWGWADGAHAQQQPAASPSVAASPKTQAAAPAHVAAQEHAKPAAKTVSTSSTSHVQATVAVNATVDTGKPQEHYQPHPRGYLDPYRNAVTPPVDSGR